MFDLLGPKFRHFLMVVNSLEGPVREEALRAFGHAFKVFCLRAINFPPIWKRLRDLSRALSKWEFDRWGPILGISLGDWCDRVRRCSLPENELDRFLQLEDDIDQLRRTQDTPSVSNVVAALGAPGLGIGWRFYIRLLIAERLDREIDHDPSRYESWEKTELRYQLRALARSVSKDL